MKNKKTRKLIIGWVVIALMCSIDFTLVNNLLLESNTAMLAATLGAALFCVGLDGAPTFLSMGIADYFGRIRLGDSKGKMKAMTFMILGGVGTLISFTVYFYIRADAIAAAGEAGGARYLGYQGDIILTVVPIITSIVAFCVGLWMSPDAIEAAEEEVQRAQAALDFALAELDRTENNLINSLSAIWSRHFPGENMPSDCLEATARIRSSISNELESRLRILLPQIISETNLVTPFDNSFKEIFKSYAEDPKYLSMVNIPQYDPGSAIGTERDRLRKEIDAVTEKIVETVTKRRFFLNGKAA